MVEGGRMVMVEGGRIVMVEEGREVRMGRRGKIESEVKVMVGGGVMVIVKGSIDDHRGDAAGPRESQLVVERSGGPDDGTTTPPDENSPAGSNRWDRRDGRIPGGRPYPQACSRPWPRQ